MHGYLSADIICSEKRTVFRERSSRKTVSFEEQVMSKDKYLCIFLKPNGCYCAYYPSNIFFTKPQFGRPLLKAFKRQRNSVSAQNIISLFKVFSFIYFNNLLGTKTKRANVNRKVLKLGNITWGISPDIPQFWLHHVMCFDQSRARKIFDEKYLMDYKSRSLTHEPKQARYISFFNP